MAVKRGAENGGAETATEVDGAAATPSDADVTKIRDILFGGQMHDYELRFAALEDRVAKAAAAVRDEAGTRLDALEASVRKEIAALALRVDALDERTATDRDDLRRHSDEIAGDLRRTHEALTGEIGAARSASVDREGLARMLGEVATRLSDAPAAEDGEGS